MQQQLFENLSNVAERQPKTDRLILERELAAAGASQVLDEAAIERAHAILIKWADLEKSGRLARLNENQLQGDLLAEVFCDALGYVRPTEGGDAWTLEQHHTIAGAQPDAVLGHFAGGAKNVLGVVELKGPRVHLDRDRSGGRTAVDQCWDYLVNTPATCRWGVVSNIVSFRLYERDSTKRAYEHFSLQELRDRKQFRKFYVLFHYHGLVRERQGHPWALSLLKRTRDRQKEVGDKLYDIYSERRTKLLEYLHLEEKHPLDMAIEMTQRLLDRVIFIAFCEDRHLLQEDTIPSAFEVSRFELVTNPIWQNFKHLFRFLDQGESRYDIPQYNGGLFAPHPVDDLELPDDQTRFFKTISGYDFADEVNLDVLGHLFERSITELEKLKESALFGGDAEKIEQYARMPQSAKRKQLGVYYTPPELTSRIVEYTVHEIIAERYADLATNYGVTREDALKNILPDDVAFWRAAIDLLREIKVVDPACGSGAFLFQAYDVLEARYLEAIRHLEADSAQEADDLAAQVPHFILGDNLYGVDLSPEAVEITQLALWIRSANYGQTLATLSENIVHGNSLVHDAEVDPAGFDWRERFADVFNRPQGGFDCVIGNPPWERIKLQEREFFSLPAPEIATATNAAKRRTLVAKLESHDPALYERYNQAKAAADALLTYCRRSDAYPLTGKGDINTYAVFAELASQLVAPHGRVGLLTPSGIASDKTTKDFFAAIAETNRLIRLFDFANKKVFFPDVHASFKFCILNFGGESLTTDAAQFVFFAHKMEDLDERHRQIELSGDDIKLLNPNTRTCPIFRTRRDAEITKAIYRRVPVLIDKNREGPTGNPWGIKFRRMFDQTNDAELFREADALGGESFQRRGNRWVKGEQTYLPVYEAKMLQMYDHRAGDVVTAEGNWVRQGQVVKTSLVNYQNPEHTVTPRFWVSKSEVESRVEQSPSAFMCFKDVTSPTNQRTMIAAMAPQAGVVNSAPITVTSHNCSRTCCLLANLNAFAYDFVIRQKISNVHLNFFIVEQVPTLSPDAYDKPASWQPDLTLETWISERVLKLSCTAEDMLPLAEACEFTSGSFQQEYGGRLNKWDEAERVQLMAELDAAYFHLYGISRDDAEYILSTFKGIHEASGLTPGRISIAENVLRLYDELDAATSNA